MSVVVTVLRNEIHIVNTPLHLYILINCVPYDFSDTSISISYKIPYVGACECPIGGTDPWLAFVTWARERILNWH